MEKTIAVITGAGSGLGAALARQLSRPGINHKYCHFSRKTGEGNRICLWCK